MPRSVIYYGFYFDPDGHWVIEAVFSDRKRSEIDFSSSKQYAIERCRSLNRKLANHKPKG